MATTQIYENAISLLESTALVDLQSAAETTLFTCPAGKNAVVTHIIARKASASLASVSSVAFGTNAGTRNDWDASARTLALITSSSLVQILTPTLPGDSADQISAIVTASGTFGIKVTTGAAVTCTFDIFGYYFDA